MLSLAKRFICNALKTLSLFSFAPQTTFHVNDDQPQVKREDRLD